MKVCKYCGTQNDNNVAFCTQCGANSFSYKCVNCGTVFDTPHCPMCGVSADAMPRYCPNCGRKTFSNCCPDCGTNLVGLPTSRNIYASPSAVSTPTQSATTIPQQAKAMRKPNKQAVRLLLIVFVPYIGVWPILADAHSTVGAKVMAIVYSVLIMACAAFAPREGYSLESMYPLIVVCIAFYLALIVYGIFKLIKHRRVNKRT